MSINVEMIRIYLWQNKLTGKEFCEKSGISYSTFSKILNNQRNYRFTSIIQVAKTMNVPVQTLFKD